MRNTLGSLMVGPLMMAGEQGSNRPQQNQPPKGNNAPPPAAKEDAEEINPFRAMFHKIAFKAASATSGVYGEERLSQKLASVLLSVAGPTGPIPGAILSGSIKAVMMKDDDEAVAEFIFMAQQHGGQCLKAEDAKSARQLDEFRAYVVDEFVKWREAGGISATSTPVAAVKLGLKLQPKKK